METTFACCESRNRLTASRRAFLVGGASFAAWAYLPKFARAADGRDPRDDYKTLLSELKLYNPALLKKPRLVVANKMDLPEAAENLKKFEKRVRRKAIPIAAATKPALTSFPMFLLKVFSISLMPASLRPSQRSLQRPIVIRM